MKSSTLEYDTNTTTLEPPENYNLEDLKVPELERDQELEGLQGTDINHNRGKPISEALDTVRTWMQDKKAERISGVT